ncbi:MAG: sigma-70 family RNA polymerase sigma factor [Pseudomonadota bacterium]
MTGSNDLSTELFDHGLRAYIESIVGTPDRADDVQQALAEKLLRNPPKARNLRNFLFSAARNAAIDKMRADTRRTDREQAFATQWNGTEVEPETIVDRERFIAVLDAALRELPLLSQSIFRDHHILGLSQIEIARHHGLHVSTVEKRLAKARKHCFNSLTIKRRNSELT